MNEVKRRSVATSSASKSQSSLLGSTSSLSEYEQQGVGNGVSETRDCGSNARKSSDCMDVPWDERHVWIACLIARFLNALIVKTYFNPDEHWQALEVAHHIVFGYGHLTWEWNKGLRSYLHPLIFASLYKLLALCGLDSSWFMVKAPRLLQALFAAVGDVYLFKLSRRVFGERVARWTLFCQMVNWFTFYCIVRTFSNCFETVLTTIALYYWPTVKKFNSKPKWNNSIPCKSALFIAGFACAMRPTSAIIWVYVGVSHLIGISNKLDFILFELVPIGAVVFGATCLLDRWMYGKWVLVHLNFLQYNLLSAGGEFYGSHPWHWYFTQGFPTMMLSMLPLMLAGIWWSKEWWLAGLLLWFLGIYSILGHKEFRFVLPALPWALMFSGYALATLEHWKEEYSEEMFNGASKEFNERIKSIKNKKTKWPVPFQLVIFGLLLTNIPIALYTSAVHQRGAEAVMEYLRKEALDDHVSSVMFLMPCHSTPYYSSLHKNVSMRFLDCSPSDQEGYIDEADRFMSNPVAFLSSMYEDSNSYSTFFRPSHLVLFDSLKPRVHDFLEANSYREVQKFFHSHFPVDRELQANVLVYAETSRL